MARCGRPTSTRVADGRGRANIPEAELISEFDKLEEKHSE
jgi:hypothetical protein